MGMTPVDFIQIPENPVPFGGQCFRLDTPDGAQLRVATFPPAENSAERASIMLVSGRSEFIEKYFEVIEDLQRRGFSITTMDWRGQGLSSRQLPIAEKGHINNFETFNTDLLFVLNKVANSHSAAKKILMTHSMGGVPGLQLIAQGYDGFIGAILSAPMTRLFANAPKRIYTRVLSRMLSKFGLSRQSIPGIKEHSLQFEGNILTSDPHRHARFRALQAAAPNAMIGSPTFGWLKAATDAIDQIHDKDYMGQLKTPILIVSAQNDQLIDSSDHPQLAHDNEFIECVIVKDALHELLMERDEYRDIYWQHFDRFTQKLL